MPTLYYVRLTPPLPSQCAQLSTLGTGSSAPWHPLARLSVAFFSLPLADFRCLSSDEGGWTSVHSLYAFIYTPAIIGGLLYAKANASERNIKKRFKTMLITIMLLWYSPVLQSAAQMVQCFDDRESGESRLKFDRDVSCDDASRMPVLAHVVFVFLVVGVGFPLYIFIKTRKLLRLAELTADKSISSVYETYRPDMCYFESICLLRKFLLVLSATLVPAAAIPVNLAFLVVLHKLRPFVSFSSQSFFKGSNLFEVVEKCSAGAVLFSNVLSLIGYSDGPVGVVFGIFTLSFIVWLDRMLYWTASKGRGKRAGTATVFPTGGGDDADDANEVSGRSGHSISVSAKDEMDDDVLILREDWKAQLAYIYSLEDGSKKKESLKKELVYSKSKLVEAIRKKLNKNFNSEDGEFARHAATMPEVTGYDKTLLKINKDLFELSCIPNARPADQENCLGMCMEDSRLHLAMEIAKEADGVKLTTLVVLVLVAEKWAVLLENNMNNIKLDAQWSKKHVHLMGLAKDVGSSETNRAKLAEELVLIDNRLRMVLKGREFTRTMEFVGASAAVGVVERAINIVCPGRDRAAEKERGGEEERREGEAVAKKRNRDGRGSTKNLDMYESIIAEKKRMEANRESEARPT